MTSNIANVIITDYQLGELVLEIPGIIARYAVQWYLQTASSNGLTQ